MYDLPLQQRIKVPLSGLDKGRLIADAVALKLCFVGIPILFIQRDIQIVHPVSPALHIRQHHKIPWDLQFQTHAARQGRQFVFLLQKQPDGVLRPLRAGYQSFGMTDVPVIQLQVILTDSPALFLDMAFLYPVHTCLFQCFQNLGMLAGIGPQGLS